MHSCIVVPLMAGAGSWRLRNGLKLVESDMCQKNEQELETCGMLIYPSFL
jgi:hypothetical protein